MLCWDLLFTPVLCSTGTGTRWAEACGWLEGEPGTWKKSDVFSGYTGADKSVPWGSVKERLYCEPSNSAPPAVLVFWLWRMSVFAPLFEGRGQFPFCSYHILSDHQIAWYISVQYICDKLMHERMNGAAAAAKSCRSCLTLCNPIDGSPPGSSVPWILQARKLEWAAISFSKWMNRWIEGQINGLMDDRYLSLMKEPGRSLVACFVDRIFYLWWLWLWGRMGSVPQFAYLSVLSHKTSYDLFIICFVKW